MNIHFDDQFTPIFSLLQVITFLNEQINQYQLGGTFVSPNHGHGQGSSHYSSSSNSHAVGSAPHTVTPSYSSGGGSGGGSGGSGKSSAYTPSAKYEFSAPYSATSVAKSESFGVSPQTVNFYPSTTATYTSNTATTTSQRGQQQDREVRTSFVQGYKSLSSAMPSSSSVLASGGASEDPYRVGLRKLGLEAEFGDDFIRGLHSPQPSVDLSHEEVDLDMLGYYSLAGDTDYNNATSSKRTTTKTGAQGTTGKSVIPHKLHIFLKLK